MILSMNTKDIMNDLKNLEDIFDFSSLDETHELFGNKKTKRIWNFKIETPKNIWIVEFVCLRSKAYSFKCNDNKENKNKKKVFLDLNQKILNLKNITIVFGGECQKDCDNYIIRSLNHGMYLEGIRKFTLSIFDDKRCYINETESKPWIWKSSFYWKRFLFQ